MKRTARKTNLRAKPAPRRAQRHTEVAPVDGLAAIDARLRKAIGERRQIAFVLEGLPRSGEPHDYGLYKGIPRLLFRQTGGKSKSGGLPNWRLADLAKISALEILSKKFSGPRPV